jgi:hypothetical protein
MSVGYQYCPLVHDVVTHSWESTVVPEIAFVGKTVADESKLAFLDVLLDRVEELFFRDLYSYLVSHADLREINALV